MPDSVRPILKNRVLKLIFFKTRGVEDATLTLVDLIASNLYKAGTSVRVLSMDMSAAFQTIQHHVLIERPFRLRRKFRPQRVRLNARMLVKPLLSGEIVVNTGATQGGALSLLYLSNYIQIISDVMTQFSHF